MSASVLALNQEKRCFLSCHGQIKGKLHRQSGSAVQRVRKRSLHHRSTIQIDAVAPGIRIMASNARGRQAGEKAPGESMHGVG
jgi:hypothetical protein